MTSLGSASSGAKNARISSAENCGAVDGQLARLHEALPRPALRRRSRGHALDEPDARALPASALPEEERDRAAGSGRKSARVSEADPSEHVLEEACGGPACTYRRASRAQMRSG
jgi:hypothetical protein